MIVMGFILVLISQSVIKNYFRKDSFRLLDVEYDRLVTSLQVIEQNADKSKPLDNVRIRVPGAVPATVKPSKEIKSVILVKYDSGLYDYLNLRLPFGDAIIEKIKNASTWPVHGETMDEGDTIFYSVREFDLSNFNKRLPVENVESTYYVSYISEGYSVDLTKNVMLVFVVGLSVLIVSIGLILFLVFKQIGKRLNHLEKGTSNIGKGHFDTVIAYEPYDEIGRLGEAMNRMGKQLSLIQEEQADNFQTISHELKTPIMVMQGYMDALVHDQYPNGTKEATYEIVIQELNKLEKLTKDLIALNKSDYLSRNNVTMTELSIKSVFEDVIETHGRDDIKVTISGDMTLIGDEASWSRIIENIMTNQVRYAKAKIDITLGESIYVRNDGDPIEPMLLKKIMKPFVKGKSGRSGLGLTIIVNTLKLYHFTLSIENTEAGVLYRIEKET